MSEYPGAGGKLSGTQMLCNQSGAESDDSNEERRKGQGGKASTQACVHRFCTDLLEIKPVNEDHHCHCWCGEHQWKSDIHHRLDSTGTLRLSNTLFMGIPHPAGKPLDLQ